MIPGSHRTDDAYAKQLQEELSKAQTLRSVYRDEEMPGLGVDGKDVPAVVFESVAGDIVIFDHNTKARVLPASSPQPAVDPSLRWTGCSAPAARGVRRLRHPPHVHRANPIPSPFRSRPTPQPLGVSR